MATKSEKGSGLTHKRLCELVVYESATGVITWLIDRGNTAKAGVRAGYLDRNMGYRFIYLEGTRFLEHRVIVFYMTKKWPRDEVDHENLARNDNRWENLREATRQQNSCNQRVRVTNQVQFRGVTKRRYGFHARIMAHGKSRFIGSFKSAELAAQAYADAARQHHGEFNRG